MIEEVCLKLKADNEISLVKSKIKNLDITSIFFDTESTRYTVH